MSSIYLSKSNLASPVRFAKIKELLETNSGTQVRYFNGGAYSDRPLLDSDKLLLLLPDKSIELVGNQVQGYYKARIGRGQYEQISKFSNARGCADIYIITKITDDEVSYSQFKSFLDIDHTSSDWNSYATIAFQSNQVYSTKRKRGPVVVNIKPETFKFKEEPKRRRLILLHKGF